MQSASGRWGLKDRPQEHKREPGPPKDPFKAAQPGPVLRLWIGLPAPAPMASCLYYLRAGLLNVLGFQAGSFCTGQNTSGAQNQAQGGQLEEPDPGQQYRSQESHLCSNTTINQM